MVNVVFIHPDLGIGGAERLIVDAALALKSRKHSVHLVTAHHDASHCFPETVDGSFPVTCVGDWLPRSVFGLGYAVCAYFRMIYAAVYAVFFSSIPCDVVVCDQISACIPLLKMKGKKVLFYCHFPDQLLTDRCNLLKRIYRAPIDWVEEKTTAMADLILVNSKFTAEKFRNTFQSIKVVPRVVYPSLNFSAFDGPVDGTIEDLKLSRDVKTIFLSINRFERKKNLGLALKALALLRDQISSATWQGIHLIVAGGYDTRIAENVQHHDELKEEAERLDIGAHVTFLRSFSDTQKRLLLHSCTCLVYTPQGEHLGIVPLEAMYMSRPVIAANSGGPTETVLHEQTGFLCEPRPEEFAGAMKRFAQDRDLAREMGKEGHEHVQKRFSFGGFTESMDEAVCVLAEKDLGKKDS